MNIETKNQADQADQPKLTELKEYQKLHVPFGSWANEPYMVTRATAHCSTCARRVHLTENSEFPGQWTHVKTNGLRGVSPSFRVFHKVAMDRNSTEVK